MVQEHTCASSEMRLDLLIRGIYNDQFCVMKNSTVISLIMSEVIGQIPTVIMNHTITTNG